MFGPPTAEPAVLGNRYKLFELLGVGGMGNVYRAYDQLTGDVVALKRLPRSPMRPVTLELRLSLAHEFQALAGLCHPNVITVRDYGFDAEQQPYFTMELLPWSKSFIAAGELLPEEGKINLLLQLLSALIYIHRCDFIHRDLKPGNVLVTAEGRVKVLDFGLAAIPGEELPTSGTLPYMAPEILQRDPASFSSDLYAVGVMAYELFTGWHPFAHTSNLPQAILYESPDFSLVDISEDLKVVFQLLLAKEPANRYDSAAETLAALCDAAQQPLPPETVAVRESFLQAAPFIGRTKEINQLEAARRQAVNGQGSGLLIAGESGIGKSRLLQEVRIRALVDGMLVLHGQAQPNGGAYHLWVAVLRPLLLHSLPDDLEAAVLQAVMPDAARLLERIVPTAPPLPAQEAQNRLHLTVLELIGRVAGDRPIVMLLEDLHWADENSLVLLQLLMNRLGGWAIFIIGSYRPGERPQLAQQLATMESVQLKALDAARVADLSAAMLGNNGRQPELLRFLDREAEGNTFFIVEVMRALAEEAGRLDRVTAVPLPATVFPSGIQEVTERRLGRIPAVDRLLLQKAAVAGRQLDMQLLAFLAPQTELESWLTTGANAGVLERPPGTLTWQFSHDKLREALLRQTAETERRQWHAQIAAGLETIYTEDLAAHYDQLAYHFAQAGLLDKERRYLGLAARHAEATYSNEAAIDFYSQLLPLLAEEEVQAAVYLALGRVCRICGRWDEALNYLQMAVKLPLSPMAVKAQACRLLGNLERSRQQYNTAIDRLNQARSYYQQLNDLSGICQTEVEIGNIFYHQGSYKVALQHIDQAMIAAKAADDEANLALVAHNFGSIAYSRGDYETAAARYQEALALRQLSDNLSELADSYNNLGLVAFRQGDWEAAQSYHEQSLALRRKVGDRWGVAASLSNLGMVPYQQRDYHKADQYWAEALAVRRLLGDDLGVAGLLDNLALVAAAQEDYEIARELIDEAVAIRQTLGDRQGLAITLSNRGRLALLTADLAASETDYRHSLELAHEIGDQLGVIFALTGVAGVWAAAGHYRQATRLLAAAAAHLEKISGTWESDEKAIFDKAHLQAQATLAPEIFAGAWEDGRLLSTEAVMNLVAEAVRDPIIS